MSRTGKKPVVLPAQAQLTVEGQLVKVKGPKGEQSYLVHDDIAINMEEGALVLTPRVKTQRARAQWGLARSIIANIVVGLTAGFERRLEITGVGYRAAVAGKVLKLNLGYSHDVDYPIPDNIQITTPKPTEIVVAGADKQIVGQVSAEIRKYRPPEPYKGKGVRYSDEFIFRKEGKKK